LRLYIIIESAPRRQPSAGYGYHLTLLHHPLSGRLVLQVGCACQLFTGKHPVQAYKLPHLFLLVQAGLKSHCVTTFQVHLFGFGQISTFLVVQTRLVLQFTGAQK
jgi:hypothetical protein